MTAPLEPTDEGAPLARETFDAAWIALREPVDHRSRSAALTARAAAWWSKKGASAVLDLGSGTGSNLRYLSPRLGGAQAWTLLDHDAELLARVGPAPPAVTTEARVGDLARDGLELVGGAELVTASALLDLVAADWVDRLVAACSEAGAAALLVLSYDGRVVWSGLPDPLDPMVLEAVNAHQHTDKGLGRALGPDAAAFTEEAFRRAGYDTLCDESPWVLDASDGELAGELIHGWAEAAVEVRPGDADRIRAWGRRRVAALAEGRAGLLVGHVDLLALPPEGPEPS